MDAMLAMTIELDVARHKREVADGFAAMRKELEPPKRELTEQQKRDMALMQAMCAMSPEEIARRSYSPYWNSYLPSQQQSPFISDPFGAAAASGMNWLLGWR